MNRCCVPYYFLLIGLIAVEATRGTTETSRSNGDDDNKIPSIEIGRDVHGSAVKLPLVGAGTWQYDDEVAYESVCESLSQGYTLIDTAFGYGNEAGIGQAIRDCYHGKREDLFILTKIPGGLTKEKVHAAHVQNLLLLGVDHVDHLMVHYPSDWDARLASRENRQEEWLALEKIYRSGEARSIGISHYCPRHVDDVLDVATVVPSLNQVEYHIGSGDVDNVIEKCEKEGITFMSYSPLCGPCTFEDKNKESLIHGDLVSEIGRRYGKSGSQISLRYIVQQALKEKYFAGVIPKSNNADHIKSNKELFDFEISEEDMQRLKNASSPSGTLGDCDVSMFP